MRTVIPDGFNLDSTPRVITGREGQQIVIQPKGMVTILDQTCGELSKFFIGLIDGKLVGSRCPSCGQVSVQGAIWQCPSCNFVQMHPIKLPHHGVLAHTAPITIFPSANFHGQAPFCRGYVDIATQAPARSYLNMRLETTTGLPRPGIFVQGTLIKVVFRDQRHGEITDIFGVPMAEVSADLREVEPLLASQLNFANPLTPQVTVTTEKQEQLQTTMAAMQTLTNQVEHSTRAKKDLGDSTFVVSVKTGGGDFSLKVEGGRLMVEGGLSEAASFTMVAEDPLVFAKWVDNGSLNDAFVEGKLWLPHRAALALLTTLDRLPRSVRRDEKQSVNPAQHKIV